METANFEVKEKRPYNIRRRKKVNPSWATRAYIEKAVKEYLKAGGKITQIENENRPVNHAIPHGDASEFLIGDGIF